MSNGLRQSIDITIIRDLYNLELIRATNVAHSLSRHTHSVLCIGVIEKGVREFFCRGTNHISAAGNVIVINPGDVHTCKSFRGNSYSYRMLCLNEATVRKAFLKITGFHREFPYINISIIDSNLLFKMIVNLCDTLCDGTTTLEKESLFLDVMAAVFLSYGTSPPKIAKNSNKKDYRAVNTIREYLEENFSKNITSAELSHLTGLSTFYLNRVFSNTVGLPPHEFLNTVRIKNAKAMLAAGKKITDTAFESGFLDQSHFYKNFKKVVGITPGQYVRLMVPGKPPKNSTEIAPF